MHIVEVLSDSDIDGLRLPPAPFPRPGTAVVWNQNGRRYEGELLGHRYDGRPTVRHRNSPHSDDLTSFDDLRPVDPFDHQAPNWQKLPNSGLIAKPSTHHVEVLEALLRATFPSGRTYFEIAEEVWARGFEIYLVGGTVRDVIAGAKPNDIDFITTMPLCKLVGLAKSVCRYRPDHASEAALKFGHIRIGGIPGSTDPFADVSVFKFDSVGTLNTVFGSDFERDMIHRDFTCNSIYYDPINRVFVDPSGSGIADATNLILRPVFKLCDRPNIDLAKIVIRMFKFTSRGYDVDRGLVEYVSSHCAAALQSLNTFERVRYIRTQILSKHPKNLHDGIIHEYREQFRKFGVEVAWTDLVEPHLLKIRGRSDDR